MNPSFDSDSGRRFSTDSDITLDSHLQDQTALDSPRAFRNALTRLSSCVDQPSPDSLENGTNLSDLLDEGDPPFPSDSSHAHSGHNTMNGGKGDDHQSLEEKLRLASELGQMLIESNEQYQQKNEALTSENRTLTAEIEDLKMDSRQSETQSVVMQDQLEDARDKVRRLETKLRESELTSETLKDQNDSLQRKHSELSEVHRQLQSDYRAERDLMLAQISNRLMDGASPSKYASASSSSSSSSRHRARGVAGAGTGAGDSSAVTNSGEGGGDIDSGPSSQRGSMVNDLGILDTTALVQMLKDLRQRNQSLQAELAQRTDEAAEARRSLETSERRTQRLTRELDEERKSSADRQKSNDYMQQLRAQLDEDRKTQREVIENLEREKDTISGKMESMAFSALHYQKKWDEEKRLRSESRRQLEQTRSQLSPGTGDDDDGDSASSPAAASKTLFDELQRLQADNASDSNAAEPSGPSAAEPSAARDCNQEFFYLTCLSVKVGLATRYKTDLSSLRSAELFELSRKKRVPFHQYHHFIEQQVISDYRKKAIRQKEAAEKRRAALAAQQQARQKELEALNSGGGRIRKLSFSPIDRSGRRSPLPSFSGLTGGSGDGEGGRKTARGIWNQMKESLFTSRDASSSTASASATPSN